MTELITTKFNPTREEKEYAGMDKNLETEFVKEIRKIINVQLDSLMSDYFQRNSQKEITKFIKSSILDYCKHDEMLKINDDVEKYFPGAKPIDGDYSFPHIQCNLIRDLTSVSRKYHDVLSSMHLFQAIEKFYDLGPENWNDPNI